MSEYNEKNDTYGYIYILSNPSMPDVYKVGRSINGGKYRAEQLFTTGVPERFELIFELYTSCCYWVEKAAHQYLNNYRISDNREFFRCEDQSIIVSAVCQAALEGYGLAVNDYDYIFSFDDAERILRENNLTPSREGWQRIRPLINRFFGENPVLLKEVLSYVFPKKEIDLGEEIQF